MSLLSRSRSRTCLVADHPVSPDRSPEGVAEASVVAAAERLEPFAFDADQCGAGGHEAIGDGMPAAGPRKRMVRSSASERAGQPARSRPGKGGRSAGRWRKKPKALTASAAEDVGRSNLVSSSSLPGAASRMRSMSGPGTPGRKRSGGSGARSPSLPSPAHAPQLFAELHEATSLRWRAWRFRIRSGAACGATSPDCERCWTGRYCRAFTASGRLPIASVSVRFSRWPRPVAARELLRGVGRPRGGRPRLAASGSALSRRCVAPACAPAPGGAGG